MTNEDYEQMMKDLMNDADYLAYRADCEQEMIEVISRISDEEIVAFYNA